MLQLEIEKMSLGPYGLGHHHGKVVMVANVAPGDVAEVEIEADHRSHSLARLKRIITAGSNSRVPPCPYLPWCGGCSWQQLQYPAQVHVKAQLLSAEIERALGITTDPAILLEPAPAEFAYRSRLRLQVGRDGALGFFELNSRRLVEIDACLVAEEGISLQAAAELARHLQSSCAEIEIVKSGKLLVLVAYLRTPPSKTNCHVSRTLLDRHPVVQGLILRHRATREIIGDGDSVIPLEAGLEMRVTADLFTQVSHIHNQRLVALVMELAKVEAGAAVLDLFCGGGNFSLPALRRGARVTGVDYEPALIEAAKHNAQRNGFERAQFIAMRAADIAPFLLRAAYHPDLVILDPPRAGAKDLMQQLSRMRARRVLYVSCNLTTMLRDLRSLASTHTIERIRALDFFPNTHHAELVASAVLT